MRTMFSTAAMRAPKRTGDLEINQDDDYQSRAWKIQRLMWASGLLILLAGVAGLLGPGPFSRRVVSDEQRGFRLEYNRFERYQAPALLKLEVDSRHVVEGQTRIWFNREFVENVQLDRIDPDPERVEVAADRFVYVFNVLRTDDAVKIIWHLTPNRFGKTQGRLGVDNDGALAFTQFYFP